MNIAILLYGQPRYFNLTQKYIKNFLKIKNINFYYFGHFWEKIAYGPIQEKNKLYEDPDFNIKNLALDLKTTSLKVTNFNLLDEFLQELQDELKTSYFKNKRYQFGQHVSVHEAFKLMKQYKTVNNIHFNTIIKVRTDFVFRKIKENLKYDNLVISNQKENSIYVPNYRYKLITKNKNQDIEDKTISNYAIEQLYIDFIPDTWFLCDEISGQHIYGDWKKYYINIYEKYNKTDKHFLLKKPHNLISEICLINKISLFRKPQKPKLYYRLVNKKYCKSRFLKHKEYIKI